MTEVASRYRVNVKSSLERAEAITAALKTPSYYGKFYHLRNQDHSLPVVTLPIDLLIYRLANARTQDDHCTRIARGLRPKGFFDIGRQEDIDVQQDQHDILFQFATTGKGESVVPIADVLEKTGRQTEPILVTSGGVVVNGNRRVAAMRELNQGTRLGSFSHVACMVLPESATEDDLLEIEFKLQMSPETRLPYTWTNEGRICKQLRDAGKPVELIAAMKNTDAKNINVLIQMYEAAERYQNEWLKQPGDFEMLDETRQAFSQMVTRRQRRSPQEIEVAQAFGFFVIENRKNLDERAYTFINAIEADPATFAQKFADTSGIALTPAKHVAVDEQALLIEFEDMVGENDLLPLVTHLHNVRGDVEKVDAVLQTVEAVVELLDAQKKDAGGVALKLAKDALKKLSNVDPNTASTRTINELILMLSRIEEKAQSLLVQAQARVARR
jgi:hypothetical protein